ncbi:hypothetical protein [Jeotgalibacillus malaysiensis]|uniref:hypothetical protein n=1 Tax=Jeotgalibacillus malaysiensis TaxID=1508404 RepID=UPI0038504529
MPKEWTLTNAVKKFTPHQLESLKKNKGNMNRRQIDSLIKEMECYYESVEEKGRGKNRVFYTDNKRKEKVKKRDFRQYNKGQAPAHSKYLALMVMNKIANVDNIARTKNGWASYFGVISPAEQDIMSGIFNKESIKPYHKYMNKMGILEDLEEQVFQDIANTIGRVSKVHLFNVFKQASENNMGLIRIVSSWKGKIKNVSTPINVETSIANEIILMENQLLKKYGISKAFSLIYKNDSKTKSFKAEWLEYIKNVTDLNGNVMNLQYIYEVFQIKILAEDVFKKYIDSHYPDESEDFDENYNEIQYHHQLLKYVIDNAERKQKNYIKKRNEKLNINNEDTKEFLLSIGYSKSETDEYIIHNTFEVSIDEHVNSPYLDLLVSENYVKCVKHLHGILHEMNIKDCERIKEEVRLYDLLVEEEIEKMSKTKVMTEDRQKVVLESFYETKPENKDKEKLDEFMEINESQKSVTTDLGEDEDNTIVESLKIYNDINSEYEAAMAEINEEIRDYEQKYGDRAMEYLTFDSAMRYLNGKTTLDVFDKPKIDNDRDYNMKFEEPKNESAKDYKEKLVLNEQSHKNPLAVFEKIRGKSK